MTEPTAFGKVVLDMMRERNIADASEIADLDRLDIKALRRHFDGDRALHRRVMVSRVADGLDATEAESIQMAMSYMGWESILTNA